jgi:hypothetical protein
MVKSGETYNPSVREVSPLAPKESTPYVPERLNPDVEEAVNYLKHWKKDLLKQKDFRYLKPVLNVLTDCLTPDLTTNLEGRFPLDAIAEHTFESANERPWALGNLISKSTIKRVRQIMGVNKLGNYWNYSLTIDTEHPSSLTNRGGVHRIGVRPDRESKTMGGEEIQQALAARLLQGADNARVMGNVPIQPEFEMTPYPDRQPLTESATAYLEAAKKGKLKWQKQKHLAHIKVPVAAAHTHDELIVIKNGHIERRNVQNPQDNLVRIFRAATGKSQGYYYDAKIEDVLMLDPTTLGKILSSKAESTARLKANWKWRKVANLKKTKDTASAPSYSISAGIDQNKHRGLQKAARSGNSIMHCNFDYGLIQLEFGHLYKDGAAAKQDAKAVAYATQYGRGKSLAKSTLPQTEILPPYEDFQLPSHEHLEKLLDDLLLGHLNQEPALLFRENTTLLRMIYSLGLQDLRLRFKETNLKETKHLVAFVDQLNQQHHAPKIAKLNKFIASHQSARVPLSEGAVKVLQRLVANKFQPQHIAEFATEAEIGPTAANDIPLKRTHRLAHRSVPESTRSTPYLSQPWVERWWTEYALGQLSATGFNVLQLGSAGWRKLPMIGTESLGKFFSRYLTYKMFVQSHISDLGDFQGNVNGLDVELDYFETARPSMRTESFVSSAVASFTHQEKNEKTKKAAGYVIRSTSRDTLLPTMQNVLPINDSPEFRETLTEVMSDLITTGDDATAVRSEVMQLYNRWIEESQYLVTKPKFRLFGSKKAAVQYLEGNIVLTKLILENETRLRRGDRYTNPVLRAFQILLAAGIRNIHNSRLENTLHPQS